MKKVLRFLAIFLLGALVGASGTFAYFKRDSLIKQLTLRSARSTWGTTQLSTEAVEQAWSDNIVDAQLLVNQEHPLPDSFDPGTLLDLYAQKKRSFQLATSTISLPSSTFVAMERMFARAKEDGVTGFIVTSGHRTQEKQQQVFNETAAGFAAPPGASEHQTGYAFDVTALDSELGFDTTEQYRWLEQHCWEYGFVIRYPRDKSDITKIENEPWHYRYVGVPHSLIICEKNYCLEEYIDYIKRESSVDYTLGSLRFEIRYVDQAALAAEMDALTGKDYRVSYDNAGGAILTVRR